MVKVELTPEERRDATVVGFVRQKEASKYKDKHGLKKKDGLSVHVLGASGELAYAKVAGIQWDMSVNTFRSRPDVGDMEVRTRSKHSYDLIVRADDDPSKTFVLVTTEDGKSFRVHGTITASAARRPEWEKTYGGRPPAWFVPKDQLTSIDVSVT